MRRYQQVQILEVLASVEQAQALGRYSDCQDGALALCDFIDGIKGEGTQTVEFLVEYCEMVFEASNGKLAKELLHKQLSKIENCVRNELTPTKIEVVFLPYKASMADSLESIYIAAKNDPHCDAFWVPIPYFDYNPDRSLGQIQYEGDLYPQHLSPVDWQTYDIEARRPDIIFAHNPYDNQNIVTCVHPNFHFERMQNFTQMLCYVPYFVGINDVQESFCVLPGTIFADKVFVQSEKVKDTYIRVFSQWVKTSGITENHPLWKKVSSPHEKFIASGSPKMDAVINAKPEDFTLPDEWRRIIEKADGSRKKVVMYNNRFTDMNTGIDKQIAKVEYVLSTFKKRDDVVLWWRPHPLNFQCLHTMRPQNLHEYKQLVDEYKNEAWGIYDDSPDLHRAIALSDAYYGDMSSLVELFHNINKPVMINDITITSDDRKFMIMGIHVSNDYIWVTFAHINGLIRINKNDSKMEWVGNFPNEKLFTSSRTNTLYMNITENNGVLYFPPFMANEISLYNPEKGVLEKLRSEECFSNTEKNENDDKLISYSNKFIYAFPYKEKVFFTPFLFPAILELDLNTNKTTYFNGYISEITKQTGVSQIYFNYPAVVDNYLWMVSFSHNIIVSFDMETHTTHVYAAGENEYKYSGICFDGENYWLSPYVHSDTPLIKWHPEKGVMKEICEIYSFDDDSVYSYKTPMHSWHRGFYANGFIWMLPGYSQHPLKIDIHTDTVSIAYEFRNECFEEPNNRHIQKFTQYTIKSSVLYAFDYINGIIIEFDFNENFRRDISVKCTQEISDNLKSAVDSTFLPDVEKNNSSHSNYETGMIQINDYISYVLNDAVDEERMMYGHELNKKKNVNTNETAGGTIHKLAKKHVSE